MRSRLTGPGQDALPADQHVLLPLGEQNQPDRQANASDLVHTRRHVDARLRGTAMHLVGQVDRGTPHVIDDHLKVTFKAKRCRQGAVGYLKFWSRGSSRRAVAHGERNRNTITSTPRKPLGWRSRQTADRGVGFSFPAPRFKASPVPEAN